MAFKSREMMKKIMRKVAGEGNLAPGVKESVQKSIPYSKVIMGGAHRGLFAGHHIQFGNRISEDSGIAAQWMVEASLGVVTGKSEEVT